MQRMFRITGAHVGDGSIRVIDHRLSRLIRPRHEGEIEVAIGKVVVRSNQTRAS